MEKLLLLLVLLLFRIKFPLVTHTLTKNKHIHTLFKRPICFKVYFNRQYKRRKKQIPLSNVVYTQMKIYEMLCIVVY
jgi:hypothetical protein